MEQNTSLRGQGFIQKRIRQKRWQKVVTVMAALVVFCTTYALILPAITLEKKVYCNHTEHMAHSAEAGCYTVTTTLTCSQEESAGHTHDASCYEKQRELICTSEESSGHKHDDSCFISEKTLTCTQQESSGHTHGEACYNEEGALICDEQESSGHSHDESCYSVEKILACDKPETEGHTHSETCYSEVDILVCQEQENQGHTHSEACYKEEKTLTCQKEVHKHSTACYSNPKADIEEAKDWEKKIAKAKLTGIWSDDVVTIAETQLGYTESKNNYIVGDNGKKMGYTRYGNWYGNSYGHWCAMFASFCMNYAGVDREAIPLSANCQRWIDILSTEEYNLYHDNETYIPKPGDLIFFDWQKYTEEELRHSDHVGIVAEVIYDKKAKKNTEAIELVGSEIPEDSEEEILRPIQIKTIEGNSSNKVRYVTYDATDDRIMGYGQMPENPDYVEGADVEAPTGQEGSLTGEAVESDIQDVPEEDDPEQKEAETPVTESTETEVPGTEATEAEVIGTEMTGTETEEGQTETTEAATEATETEATETENSEAEETEVTETEIPDTEAETETEVTEVEEIEVEETESSETETAEKTTRIYEGEDYVVTISYTAEAEIPVEAILQVSEIKTDSEEYKNYCDQAAEILQVENLMNTDPQEVRKINTVYMSEDTEAISEPAEIDMVEAIVFARFFDIKFTVGDEIIEPKVPVDVEITYQEPIEISENEKSSIVHFADAGTEIIPAGTDYQELEVSSEPEISQEELEAAREEEWSILGIVKDIFTSDQKEETKKEDAKKEETKKVEKKKAEKPSKNAVNTFSFKQGSFSITGTVVTGSTIPAGEYILYTYSGGNYYALSRSGEVVRVSVSNGVVTCNDDSRTDIIWNCTTNTNNTMTISNGSDSDQVYLSLTGQRAGTYGGVGYITNLTSSNQTTVNYQLAKNGGLVLKSNDYSLFYMGNNYARFTGSASQNYQAEMFFASYVKESENPVNPGDGQSAYYQRVNTIQAGQEYLIVSVAGNYALTATSNTAVGQTALKLNPVKGNPGVYKIDNVTEKMLWNFPGATGGSTATTYVKVHGNNNNLRLSSANGYGLALDNSNRMNNYTNLLTYNSAINSWTIRRSGNEYVAYLTMNNGTFGRTENTAYANNMLILEKVATPSIPSDPSGSGESTEIGGSSETVVKPEYPAYKDTSDIIREDTQVGDVAGMAYSDAATSKLEERFAGLKAEDGKVLADKSVTYGTDDYEAFSYEPNSFGITLSALAQQYELGESYHVKTPIDVVFVLDVSGSMDHDAGSNMNRRQAMVRAVNKAMDTIFEQNKENRVGVVVYSSGSWDLLDLDYYTPSAAANGNNPGQYLITSGDNVYSAVGLKDGDGNRVVQKTDSDQHHGTYTQSGIARGAAMFERVDDTIYTATVGTEEFHKTYDINRQPIMILLSDGDPTHCTSNYMDVLSGPHYGDGVYPAENSGTQNNKGIQGYYTILSANYYKSMIGIHYNQPAKFYTVGMGINSTGYADMSGNSYTGDHYKRAVLNPTAANIQALTNNNAKNHADTADMLKQLLTNSYNSQYVEIRSTANYAQLGTTNTNVPVLPNPYSSYSYADGAKFGELSADDLEDMFDEIIKASLSIKKYGFILVKHSSIEMEDTIGDGMAMDLVTGPQLRYGGWNYPYTDSYTEGNVTTYVYDYPYTAEDGSGFEADLSQILVTVTTDAATGAQTVRMTVPDSVMPVYAPCEVVGEDNDWYYEALPVRLIYKVGLTEDAIDEIENLPAGVTKEFYTNKYDKEHPNEAGANAVLRPQPENPYYKPNGPYHDESVDKTTDLSEEDGFRPNITDTLPESSIQEKGTGSYQDVDCTIVDFALGNNGKLVFTGNKTTTADIILEKADIGSGNLITSSEAIFELYENYEDEASRTLIGTYSTSDNGVVTGRLTIQNLTIGSTYYLRETKSPAGYNAMPTVESFTIQKDSSGALSITGITPGHQYLRVVDGDTLTIRVLNSNGYTLPETGGIGTNVFTAGGAALMLISLLAGFYLRRKRERRVS